MLIKGRTWVFGRHVNTDLIFPKMWFRPTYEPGEMASHLMVGLDEDFPRKVKRGDIIVGGLNFGCGSSREEAAAAMKEAGIAAVVAPSFGRIYDFSFDGFPGLGQKDIPVVKIVIQDKGHFVPNLHLLNLHLGYQTKIYLSSIQ